MDVVLVLLLGLVIGIALGGVIGLLVGRTRATGAARSEDPAVVEARHARIVAELKHQEGTARAAVESQLCAANATVEGLQQSLADAQQQYRDAIERHQREAQARQVAEQTESKVLQAIAPVQQTLATMGKKVEELEAQRREQHSALSVQIKNTQDTAERSKLAAETLAAAMSNNSVRGVWGEAQLRSLVESAGLINRVDFTLQASITAESGARRPDLVVSLPGGKSIAVDAKVPYSAYMDASAIPASATPDQEDRRKQLLAKHAKQVRGHVDALANKTYWTGLDASPEFTIAFIPNEPLLAAALAEDPSLMEYAFAKRIALASPVSFWAVLKTVAFTWQQDVLTEDAKQLFDLGKELYGRIATLAEHADKLRRSIESTVTNYNKFAGALEQRVLVTARKLDALDESTVLGEPVQIEGQPKSLTQPEFASFDDIERAELDFRDPPLPEIDERLA